jgi:hypothetical protein
LPAAVGFRQRQASKRPEARRSALTTVGKAVLKDAAEIELIGLSFIALLDGRIKEIRQKRPNSDEARAAVESEIADREDLKRRLEEFLGMVSQFADKKAKETSIVEATNSLAAGIGDWRSKRHVQICDKASEMGLFGVGVTICLLADASGAWAIGIPGAIGAKPVVAVIKAERSRTTPE